MIKASVTGFFFKKVKNDGVYLICNELRLHLPEKIALHKLIAFRQIKSSIFMKQSEVFGR